MHCQSIPSLKVFVTHITVVPKDPPEVDRFHMVPDQTASRGFEVFAY